MPSKRRAPQPDDARLRAERQLLHCISNAPQFLARVDSDLSANFSTKDHRELWRAAVRFHSEGLEVALDIELWARESGVDVNYVADLCAGILPGASSISAVPFFDRYISAVCKAERERRFAGLVAELPEAEPDQRLRVLEQLQEVLAQALAKRIRDLPEIPEIQLLELPAADYIVPALGIARNTMTLWTGQDGSGKTMLAYCMAVAVALGKSFLGMPCQRFPVLYIDLENPGYVVQSRVCAMVGDESLPTLRVWGSWDEIQPPQFGNPDLLAICKKWQPLVIIDPFRYFHNCDEDSSTEMAPVMQYLRRCAAAGGAVVVMHHPPHTENRGRGSTGIRGACDVSFVHTLDKENNVITLQREKNRHGELGTFSIRADFEDASFELIDAPWLQHRNAEIELLHELITKAPGISTNQLFEASGGKRNHILKLLEEGAGTLWTRQPGPRRSFQFYPVIGNGNGAGRGKK